MGEKVLRFSGVRLRDVIANAFMTQENLQQAFNILETYGNREYTDPVSHRKTVVHGIEYTGNGTYIMPFNEWNERGTPMFLTLDAKLRNGMND
jgi:hypothetical protein